MNKLDKNTERLLTQMGVVKGSEIKPPEMVKIGLPQWDYYIGGIPRGRFTHIWGPDGSGKTTISLFIAKAFLKYGWVLIFDIEKSFDREWALNFLTEDEIDQIYVMQPDEGGAEMMLDKGKQLLMSNTPPSLVVVDSITATASTASIDRDAEKVLVGGDAVLKNRMIRVLNIVNRDTAMVVISQFREGIGVWDHVPDGRGLRHMASLRIQLMSSKLRAKDTDFDDGEDRQEVGVISRFNVQKSKLAKPYQRGYEIIHSDGFIDIFDSQVRLLLDLGLLVKAGAWYKVGEESLQGKTKLREWAENNPAEWGAILARLDESVGES